MENNTNFSKLLSAKVPAPKRTNFNLSRPWRSTLSPGFLNVVDVLECLPGDDISLSMVSRIKSNPTLAPILGSFKVRFFKFFVPTRLYVPSMNRNDLRTDFKNDFDLPYYTISQNEAPEEVGFVTAGSLLEQIGLPIGMNTAQCGGDIQINAVPILGYYDIFRNYFLNPQEDTFPVEWASEASYLSTLTPNITALDEAFSRYISNSSNGVSMDLSESEFFLQNTGISSVFSDPLLSYLTAEDEYDGYWELSSEKVNSLLSRSLHSGLCRTTYGNDIFMSRLATSYVDYVNSEVRVNTASGSFNISQLRLANKLAKFVDRSVLGGTRYGDWLKAHFGQQNMSHLNVPYFIGSEDYDVWFDDIVSNAETNQGGNGYLGSVGGRISEFLPAADDDKFYCKEHGYYMVLCTITPKVDYFQGIPKYLQKIRFSDIYVPELDAVGWQPILKKDMLAVRPAYDALTMADQYWADTLDDIIGYTFSWAEYMSREGSLHGQFATSQKYWTLAREFGWIDESGNFIEDFTTYVDPSSYNYAFAGVGDDVDNFYMQVYLNMHAKRNISKQILPSL